jgi:hypothetical protein
MAATEPPGDFDYLWEDLGEAEENAGFDDYDDPPSPFRAHRPTPGPWYRATPAMLAMGAIAVAVVAIIVAAVLLVSRDARGRSKVEPTIAIPSSSSSPTTTSAIVATPPPSPPPPPPSPTEAIAVAPVPVTPREQAPAKPPEIGVTRTPVTRSPISVRPEPRPAQPHR